MPRCINRITLLGRLGRDPEVFHQEAGEKFVTLSLATSESWKDKTTGKYIEKTEWHQVVIFVPRIITIAEKYLHTGSRILVEGNLKTSKWTDRDGVERWTTEVVLRQFGGELLLLDKSDWNDGIGEGEEANDNSEDQNEALSAAEPEEKEIK